MIIKMGNQIIKIIISFANYRVNLVKNYWVPSNSSQDLLSVSLI